MATRPQRTGIMLAHPANSKRIISLGPTIISQPKYNGERAWVAWIGDDPVFITSYGNEFHFLDHLKERILRITERIGKKLSFDGELYVHTWPRERIHSAVSQKKSPKDDTANIQFHIFDFKSPLPQWQRIYSLWDHESKIQDSSIHLVPCRLTLPSEIESECLQHINSGYEGIILRSAEGSYEEKRSSTMLKFKPTHQDTYLIVDYKEGIGWAEGMLGSLGVKGHDSTIFYVGTGKVFTKDNRIALWKDRHNLIGKHLLVKHEAITTKGGIPVCTVGLQIIP